jgi:hypothetical protein
MTPRTWHCDWMLVVPWATVGTIAAAAGLLAVLGTVLPAAAALRTNARTASTG